MTTFRSDSGSRRSRWRWIGYVVLLLMALIAARFLIARSFDNGPPPPVIATVMQLPISLPDGRHAVLGNLIKPGVPTVITLWASWCGPCRREAPIIAQLRRRFGRGKLTLIYLNVRDASATPEELASYMKGYGMAPDEYAVLPDDRIGALTNASDVAIPRTLVFDRAGQPIAKITGYKPFALARIDGLIAS